MVTIRFLHFRLKTMELIKKCFLILDVIIPRFYKNVYVSSIVSEAVRLWNSMLAKPYPLIYDLNGFNSTIDRHIILGFLNNFLKRLSFFSSSIPWNFMLRSGCSAFYEMNPSKKVKNDGNKRKVLFLLPLENTSNWWQNCF